jgi:ArsR family transcriptional regulator, arsenate/arsenite/antimonite-responsive transcriptional repressor
MKTETVVIALAAQAQSTRLDTCRLPVAQGPSGLDAGEIALQLKIAPATLSFHLKERAGAGLVKPRQESRFIYYAADFAAMNELLAYLTEDCCAADCPPVAGCAPAASCAPGRTTIRKAKRKAIA